MWRFDLIVTVTVMMMMHTCLHLGGRGYYYYVCVGVFLFFSQFASIGASRILNVKDILFSGCIAWPDIGVKQFLPKRLLIQKKKKGRVGVIVDE